MKHPIRALIALALLAAAAGYSYAQNQFQTIATLLGTELVEIRPAGSAYSAFTTVANLRDGRMYLYNAPLTGFAITMTVSQSVVSLNPAGTLATGTITLPPTAFDGKTVTIFSSQTITALTINTSNGATFVPAVVTTLAANASVAYVYDLANNQWHRYE